VEAYLERDIRGGTTSIQDKIIFTTTEAEVLAEANNRIVATYGFSPIRKVFVIHGLFQADPSVLDTLRTITPNVGIKWVNDGGTRNSHLHKLTYADGSKGPEPSIPIEMNRETVSRYLQTLDNHGITEVAWHVLAEGTWEHLWDAGIPQMFAQRVSLGLEHFTLVTEQDIRRAASLGIAMTPNPPYTTEVFRPDYANVLGPALARLTNPLRTIVDVYSEMGMIDRVGLASDGMPQSALFVLLSAVNGISPFQRLTLEEALMLTEDLNSIMVISPESMRAIAQTDLRTICGVRDGETYDRREEVSTQLESGVLLVANKDRVLYTRSSQL
jgi:predicted amidohydrolase YtcJ